MRYYDKKKAVAIQPPSVQSLSFRETSGFSVQFFLIFFTLYGYDETHTFLFVDHGVLDSWIRKIKLESGPGYI